MRSLRRFDWLVLAALTVLAAAIRFTWLGHPDTIVFDETYFANFAHNYLTGTAFFDAEPPLGKFLIASGEWLVGFNPAGWRAATALFGTLTVPLFYLLAKRLFGGRVLPAIAGLLALFEGLLLVESRVAVLDGFVVFFNLLTYVLFLRSLQAETRRRSLGWLTATGVSLGLALSVKWITLAFLGTAVVLLLTLWLSRRSEVVRRLFRVAARDDLLRQLGGSRLGFQRWWWYVLLLGLLPAILYLAIFQLHVPFDSTGGNLVDIHRQIFTYHASLTATHPYGSEWSTWPLLIRPVAYYFQVTDSGQWSTIIAVGNPLIWWSGLLALGYVTIEFFRRRSLLLGVILLAFLAHYAPWALIDRVLFIYHYLGGLPFVMLALAYVLARYWHHRPPRPAELLPVWAVIIPAGTLLGALLGRMLLPEAGFWGYLVGGGLVTAVLVYGAFGRLPGRITQRQVIAALVLAGLAFVYFLPIWTAWPLSPDEHRRHIWLDSWI